MNKVTYKEIAETATVKAPEFITISPYDITEGCFTIYPPKDYALRCGIDIFLEKAAVELWDTYGNHLTTISEEISAGLIIETAINLIETMEQEIKS